MKIASIALAILALLILTAYPLALVSGRTPLVVGGVFAALAVLFWGLGSRRA